jgi:hypothetical protein
MEGLLTYRQPWGGSGFEAGSDQSDFMAFDDPGLLGRVGANCKVPPPGGRHAKTAKQFVNQTKVDQCQPVIVWYYALIEALSHFLERG